MTLKNIIDAILNADCEIEEEDIDIIGTENYFLIKFSKKYRSGQKLPLRMWPALRSLGGIAKTRWGKIRSVKIYR